MRSWPGRSCRTRINNRREHVGQQPAAEWTEQSVPAQQPQRCTFTVYVQPNLGVIGDGDGTRRHDRGADGNRPKL